MHFPDFLKRYAAKLRGLGLLVLLAVLASAGAFAWIVHEVIREGDQGFDLRVFDRLAPWHSPDRTVALKVVTQFASASFLPFAYGATMLGYALRSNWLRCLEILVIGLGGFAINYFMKLAFHRVRPPHPLLEPLMNFSFPSGHATSGFIFYGLLAYLAWKTKWPRAVRASLVVVLVAWALLIGFSRIYLRMHYTSDVVAGFCSGAAWLGACIVLLEHLKRRTALETGETEQQAVKSQN